jgi:hypothetical protein
MSAELKPAQLSPPSLHPHKKRSDRLPLPQARRRLRRVGARYRIGRARGVRPASGLAPALVWGCDRPRPAGRRGRRSSGTTVRPDWLETAAFPQEQQRGGSQLWTARHLRFVHFESEPAVDRADVPAHRPRQHSDLGGYVGLEAAGRRRSITAQPAPGTPLRADRSRRRLCCRRSTAPAWGAPR